MGAKIVLRNIEKRNFYLAQTLSRTQCIMTRFVSSISNISTTLLKTVENKRHYSKNRDREQTGRDIDRSDLLERIELPLITYTYDVHIKYGRKKKRKGEREKKKGKIDVSPSDLTISLHRGN